MILIASFNVLTTLDQILVLPVNDFSWLVEVLYITDDAR